MAKIVMSSNWDGWGVYVRAYTFRYDAPAEDTDIKIADSTMELLNFAAGHREDGSRFTNDSTGILFTTPPEGVITALPYRVTFVNERNRYMVLMLMMQELCSGKEIAYVQNHCGLLRIFFAASLKNRLIELDSAMKLILDCFDGDWRRIGRAIARA